MFPPVALRIARRSAHPHYFHAAIVERGGAYISVAHNRSQTHAEVAALKKLWPSERKGVRVWSLRLTKTGRLAMAKPCAACQRFMREHGVRAVYFSTAEGKIEVMKL